MTPATFDPAPQLHELDGALDRQASLLAEIEALDRRRRAAIAAADPEAIRDLLDARERALTELARVAPTIGRLRDAGHADERVRNRLAQAAAQFDRIAASDAADLDAMTRRRADLARSLASLSLGRTAAGAYATPPAGEALYQDRRA